MSQRIRTCTNSTNFETINCESYSSRLASREKVSKPKRPITNSKPSRLELLPSVNAKSKPSQPQMVKQKNIVLKESVSNKAPCIEVTVRTKGSARNREPWNEMLKMPKSVTSTSFNQFDPLRTIHFISKELQTKLNSTSSNDPQVLYMLSTMQQALDRIPPDIYANTLSLKRSRSEIRTYQKSDLEDAPEKLVIPPILVDRHCQTISNLAYTDSEVFQKKLETSTAKLESSCKQMEILCEQLKNEKQYVEELLQAETSKVTHLKQQLETLQNENGFSHANFDKLVQERQELENKFKQLKQQVSSYHGPTVQELKGRVQDLQSQKISLEQENISLRHKLATSNMEREKYTTLLSIRDRHIHEIVNEMNCLQEVVSEQLVQLQKAPLISAPSSQSTLLDNYTSLLWPDVDLTKMKESKDNVELLKHNYIFDLPLHQLYSKPLSLESGDSSVTNVVTAPSKRSQKKTKSAPFLSQEKTKRTRSLENEKNNLTSIHELFNDLKRQAMILSIPQLSTGATPSPGNRLNGTKEPSNA
ncbi:hypothetical protein RN001_014594 [Aquatica leii]|uniref:Uncharacterized protein n=1 Tax=Aquatica leii TaxID=1421715 RepID=A0AAN7SN76_9COLE|nr:hypothetical protein RN001_014594 [Aquatica leii]